MIPVLSLWQDVRYGVRVLLGNLRFTTAAVVALAIGIGVSTTVFTAYQAMVARPLDARDPGEMVNLAMGRQSGATDFVFSYPDYEAYRDSVRAFRGVVAFSVERMLFSAGGTISQRPASSGTLAGRLAVFGSGPSHAEFASVFAVSENYFSVLGVSAVRGRTFQSDDDPAASPSVLVSEEYWQRRFGGDPALLGQTVRLNGAAVTIVGVTPKGFVGTGVAAPDFWLPIRLEPLVHGDDSWLRNREHAFCRLFARLAPGVTLAQAQSEMSAVADRLRALHDPQSDSARPTTALAWPGSPFPLPINRYAGLELTILLIMIAAAAVLVVACANVASLQLARVSARQQELQMRLSLGATRLRVIRQLLTESALLGVLAGAIALAVAWVLLQMSATLAAEAVPVEFGSLVFHVAPDLGVFAFVFGISLAAGLLFGIAPAIVSSQSAPALSARMSTAPRRTRRLQNTLVAAQVALSLVLMIAGSLLIHGARQSLSRAPGYDAAHVVDLEIQFPEASRYTDARKAALLGALRARVAALPGVASVTSARLPGDNRFQTAADALDGGRSTSGHGPSLLPYTFVEPNYFQTLRIPIVSGRGFREGGDDAREVVISESAARLLWRNQNPIGRRVRLGATAEQVRNRRDLEADGLVYDVAGVVRDTRGVAFDGSDSARLYLPLPENRLQDRPMLVRAESDAAPLRRALDAAVSSVDPDLVATASTLEEQLQRSAPFVVSSLSAAVATSLGLLGLVLASMGIYATVSYIVVRRTREVGIRIAVGARKRDILALILGESLRPVVAGLIVGLVPASAAAYLLDGVFYGLGTVDVISLAGVTALFLAIALLAAYPPSRRALRVDPIVALRSE